ncbi:MAG: hypothetical protein QNL04_13150 [SAR324 cluster bacterium]|nr:hypothetical protein [SAR324 cluster bacterium]
MIVLWALCCTCTQLSFAQDCSQNERQLLEGRLTWIGNSPKEILIFQVKRLEYKITGPMYFPLLEKLKRDSTQKMILIGVISGKHVGPGFPKEFRPTKIEITETDLKTFNCNKE